MTSTDQASAIATINRLDPVATLALQAAEQAIHAVASGEGSDKDGKAAVKKILFGAHQVLPILHIIPELHPMTKKVCSTFTALVWMETNRQNSDLTVAVVYHSMTLMMHALCYLGQVKGDELVGELQRVLDEMLQSMREFGNLVTSYYRYSAKRTIFRILHSKEYQELLRDISHSFETHRESLRMIFQARTMIAKYDVSAAIETVMTVLKAKEREEFSRSQGGLDAVIHDDALLSNVAETLGEKILPQIRSALREDLQEILENDQTQSKFALQATREQMEASVGRSELNITHHLDSGPSELINDPDVCSIWQEMRTICDEPRNSSPSPDITPALADSPIGRELVNRWLEGIQNDPAAHRSQADNGDK